MDRVARGGGKIVDHTGEKAIKFVNGGVSYFFPTGWFFLGNLEEFIMSIIWSDPSNWKDPEFHEDWGIDSKQYTKLLQDCSSNLLANIPGLLVGLYVSKEEGVIHCEIKRKDGEKFAELFCVETLENNAKRFGLFIEKGDDENRKEIELYMDSVLDTCMVVEEIDKGNDIAPLIERFGE